MLEGVGVVRCSRTRGHRDRGQQASKLVIAKVIGVETLWNGSDDDFGKGGDAPVQGGGGLCAGGVAVQQQDDARGGAEKLLLSVGEMDAEESNGGNVDLVESHDAPGALGQDESGGRESRTDTVEVEQELVTREP